MNVYSAAQGRVVGAPGPELSAFATVSGQRACSAWTPPLAGADVPLLPPVSSAPVPLRYLCRVRTERVRVPAAVLEASSRGQSWAAAEDSLDDAGRPPTDPSRSPAPDAGHQATGIDWRRPRRFPLARR